MKIYKVCGNYLKGVQEFEIQKINTDNTFIYEKEFWNSRTYLFVYAVCLVLLLPAGRFISRKLN